MRSRFLCITSAVALALSGSFAFGQTDNASPAPIKGKKVCVADVANSSLTPVFTDKLKERLVEDLQKTNINAYNAVAVTVLANQLGMSANNIRGAQRQKCDFMILSEVAKAKPGATPASAGGAGESQPPSAAANAAPATAGQLAVDFALFKKGQWSTPLATSSVPFTADSKDPNAAALAAMDQAASQVAASVKKK